MAAADEPLPVLDPQVLGRLVERLGDQGPSFRTSLIETWLGEAAERREELRHAVTEQDRRRVAQAAHALRSGSGALGARELAALCGRVEDAIRNGCEVDLPASLARVEAALDRAVGQLTA